MAVQHGGPLPYVLCPYCRGGNPVGGKWCIWCHRTLPQKMSLGTKLLVWSLVALAIVIGIAGAASTALRNNTSASPSAPSRASMGTSVSVGSWQITVEKVKTASEFDWSGFGNREAAKGRFLLVYVTARNATNRTDAINAFDYKLLDSAGALYDACISLPCISYPRQETRDSFLTDVPPRTSSKLLAIFDVARDAAGFTLEVEGRAKIALDR